MVEKGSAARHHGARVRAEERYAVEQWNGLAGDLETPRVEAHSEQPLRTPDDKILIHETDRRSLHVERLDRAVGDRRNRDARLGGGLAIYSREDQVAPIRHHQWRPQRLPPVLPSQVQRLRRTAANGDGRQLVVERNHDEVSPVGIDPPERAVGEVHLLQCA